MDEEAVEGKVNPASPDCVCSIRSVADVAVMSSKIIEAVNQPKCLNRKLTVPSGINSINHFIILLKTSFSPSTTHFICLPEFPAVSFPLLAPL